MDLAIPFTSVFQGVLPLLCRIQVFSIHFLFYVTFYLTFVLEMPSLTVDLNQAALRKRRKQKNQKKRVTRSPRKSLRPRKNKER